jgi:DNA-binding transcriptional regulator YiaG
LIFIVSSGYLDQMVAPSSHGVTPTKTTFTVGLYVVRVSRQKGISHPQFSVRFAFVPWTWAKWDRKKRRPPSAGNKEIGIQK